MPSLAAGGATGTGAHPAERKGLGHPLRRWQEGHSGEQFRSVVALAHQGRLENSIWPPPNRCIHFSPPFLTPSCTGPASRVGGRSGGGLGIDVWNKLEAQVTHISLKICVCLCFCLSEPFPTSLLLPLQPLSREVEAR